MDLWLHLASETTDLDSGRAWNRFTLQAGSRASVTPQSLIILLGSSELDVRSLLSPRPLWTLEVHQKKTKTECFKSALWLLIFFHCF